MMDPTKRRVGQLVRLLSSDKAGEVVAAAAALNRTLAGAGLDIYRFADLVEAALPNAPTLVPDDSGEDWRSIARFCHHHRDRLTEKEADFIGNLLRYEKPTPKQFQWLLDIRDRLQAVSQPRGRA